MNIALFSDSYLPTKSGIVTVVIQLRRILMQMGHHVVVVTVSPDTQEDAPPEGTEDEGILRLPSLPSPVGDNQYIGLPLEGKAVAFCEEHHIQLIHAHTEFTMGHLARVTGRKLGIPVIATTHTMWEDYYRYYIKMGKIVPKSVIRRLVHTAYKHFYALINVSQKAHDYFKNPFILPSSPSAVIPNAIDTERFMGRTANDEDIRGLRRLFGISDSEPVILYVGRIVEEKRVKELFEVCLKVVTERPDVKVLFVGDGAALPELVERAKETGTDKRILFAGFVDWFHLAAYYAIGTIFVTASLSEMHSMTVLEAMAMSLPIACRRDTSFTDTVFPGENGYLADTEEELAQRLCELAADPARCREMGKRSTELCRNFTLGIHGARTIAFYEAVLAQFPRPITDAMLESAVEKAGADFRDIQGRGI